jgi:UDP-N-acetylmuramoyl-tripeptide--D-alanyl-D-alanine ligase
MCGGTLNSDSFTGLQIAGVTRDSRSVKAGQLYIPLVGERFDGHDFAVFALEGGAAALLWQPDRPLPDALAGAPVVFVADTLAALQQLASAYRDQLGLKVVGVTGSNGKTTTKDMVASVLSGVFRVHKTEGNLNNHIGLPLTILDLSEDTEAAVLEMGMSGFGEIELLTRIAKPDVAIITNIGDAHLLQLGSREGIARAKLEIASGLRPGGLLLINGDEPLLHQGVASLALPESAVVQTFGLGEGNDWSAAGIQVGAESCTFDVNVSANAAAGAEGFDSGAGTLGGVTIPVPGKHNVSNALAAMAASARLGVPAAKIASGFQGLRLTGMRIQPERAYNGAMLLNDAYNANPTAVRAAIDLVAQLSGYRRKWLVLGDMLELGPREAELHREIGAYVTPEKADAVLTFGPLSINTAGGAAERFGLTDPAEAAGDPAVKAFDDKLALVEWLRARLAPDDLVLVKGSRGMRMEEIVHALQRA